MVSFCADIDRLFTEIPFLQRCKAARDAGFSSVEFTMPDGVGLGELGDAAAYKGLKLSVLTMPAEQSALAFDAKSKRAFLDAFDALLDKADFLECKQIHIAGRPLDEERFDAARDAFVSALHAAAPRARQAGVKILLGFKNPTENPDARLIPVVETIDEKILSICGAAGTSRGTGGMVTKVHAAQIASDCGIPTVVMNGSAPQDIYKLIDGRQTGTLFLPR